MPKNDATQTLADRFTADPAAFLAENVGKLPRLQVARALNRAGFYSKVLDTNRWTAAMVMKLEALRDDPDLCAEIAALAPERHEPGHPLHGQLVVEGSPVCGRCQGKIPARDVAAYRRKAGDPNLVPRLCDDCAETEEDLGGVAG